MNPQAVGVLMCVLGGKKKRRKKNVRASNTFLTSSSRRACLFFFLVCSCLCSSCSRSSRRRSLSFCSMSSSSSSSSCSRVWGAHGTEQVLLKVHFDPRWPHVLPSRALGEEKGFLMFFTWANPKVATVPMMLRLLDLSYQVWGFHMVSVFWLKETLHCTAISMSELQVLQLTTRPKLQPHQPHSLLLGLDEVRNGCWINWSYARGCNWLNTGEATFSAYKFGLVPLNEVSVLPLVLLHPQLGVLHVKVVRQVKHCGKVTESDVRIGPMERIPSAENQRMVWCCEPTYFKYWTKHSWNSSFLIK